MSKKSLSRWGKILVGLALATAAIALLAAACGAASGSSEPVTVAKTETGEVSFAKTIHPILQDHCTRCHGGKEREGNFSIDSYELVMKGGNRGALVVPGDPDNSQIVLSVEKKKAPHMPPKVFSPLTADRIQAIRTWIAEGAKNN